MKKDEASGKLEIEEYGDPSKFRKVMYVVKRGDKPLFLIKFYDRYVCIYGVKAYLLEDFLNIAESIFENHFADIGPMYYRIRNSDASVDLVGIGNSDNILSRVMSEQMSDEFIYINLVRSDIELFTYINAGDIARCGINMPVDSRIKDFSILKNLSGENLDAQEISTVGTFINKIQQKVVSMLDIEKTKKRNFRIEEYDTCKEHNLPEEMRPSHDRYVAKKGDEAVFMIENRSADGTITIYGSNEHTLTKFVGLAISFFEDIFGKEQQMRFCLSFDMNPIEGDGFANDILRVASDKAVSDEPMYIICSVGGIELHGDVNDDDAPRCGITFMRSIELKNFSILKHFTDVELDEFDIEQIELFLKQICSW